MGGLFLTSSYPLSVDSELVARAQKGDPEALEALIGDLRPAVLRFCRFRLLSYPGGHDAADDVTQETCLAIMDVLPRYVNRGIPFATWVFAIAANKVADSRRRFGRAAVLVDEFPEQTEPGPTPEDCAISSVEQLTARSLVQQLPDGMREVLIRRASGATASMVASDLGISPGAVNVAYHRAVVRVRAAVDGSAELRELFADYRTRLPAEVSRAA